jgi:hypothetical protein
VPPGGNGDEIDVVVAGVEDGDGRVLVAHARLDRSSFRATSSGSVRSADAEPPSGTRRERYLD